MTKTAGFLLTALCTLSLATASASADMPGRVWTRIREASAGAYVHGCVMDPASNVYVSGYTEGPLDGQTNNPPGTFDDAFVMKWDSQGEWQWTRVWGSTNAENGVYAHMAVDGTNCVYVTGYTEGEFDGETNAGDADIFLTRWSSDGTKEWSRIWGSPQYDEGYGVAVSTNGSNVFVCGYTEGSIDGETLPGDSGCFLTAFDADGNRDWTRIWGPTNDAWASSVAVLGEGKLDVYVAGATDGAIGAEPFVGGSSDMFLTKYTGAGVQQWTRIWGSTNASDDTAHCVAVHDKGLIYVAGRTAGEFDGQPMPGVHASFLSAFDDAGVRDWSRIFGPTNTSLGYGVAVSPGGHVYVGGATRGPFNLWTNSAGGDYDLYLTQWSSNGTCLWTRIWGTASNNQGYGRCGLGGNERIAVGFATSGGGFDGQSITNTGRDRPGISVYEVDYHPDAVNIERVDGNIKFSWNGAWDCLYDIQVSMDLMSGWITVPGVTNLPGAEVFCATTFPDVVTLFCRASAYPRGTWRAPGGMVYVPEGYFVMGQAGIAEPVHTNLINGFWIDQTEVSKALWDEVYNWAITNGYGFANPGTGKAISHPVQLVTWYDCVKWSNARSEKEGLTPCYYMDSGFTLIYKSGNMDILNGWVNWNAGGYRLPTEAEWEKAARGGATGFLFPWAGNTISHSQANYNSTNTFAYDVSPTRGFHPAYTNGGIPYTSPVGSFSTNAYGLYDMAGNVWEWCWDWYDVNYYTVSPTNNPLGPGSGTDRVRRGGSWFEYANYCRNAERNLFDPLNGQDQFGFRTVRREEIP